MEVPTHRCVAVAEPSRSEESDRRMVGMENSIMDEFRGSDGKD